MSRPTFSAGAPNDGQGKFVPQGELTDDSTDESNEDSANEPSDENIDPNSAGVVEDDTPKDFSTSKELLSSPEVRENSKTIERGPFRLHWPVAQMKVNRGFNEGTGRDHLGMDIGGHRGDKIYAAHDGVVVYAGHGFRGYGNMILLEYNREWATLYGHLNRIKVKTGQTVQAGSVIGSMGRTGHATGVHLHFELIKNKTPVDPAPLLRGESVAAKRAAKRSRPKLSSN